MSTAPAPAGPRRVGYALLGRGFDYLLHLRPAEWPIMAGHTALGWILATGLASAWAPETRAVALHALLLWVICLNGGTLAINSAFDDDEGDVAYLRRPPKPPPGLFAFGMLLMLGGQWMARWLPAPYQWAYLLCLLMSVAYSVPPFRLKAVAGADWVINLVGFGAVTPFAGWVASGRPVTAAGWWLFAAFGALFASLYPLTQLYQMDEDRARGDRTLSIRLGLTRALDVAIGAAVLAFGLFVAAGRAAGWGAGEWDRWAGLVVAALAWAAVLLPWRQHGAGWPAERHQRGMHLALAAWAVTDVACVWGWGR